MVPLPPDDDSKLEGASPFAEIGDTEGEEAPHGSELDTGQLSLSENSARLGAADKVELDLEDAPFLEEEEEVEEEKQPEAPAEGVSLETAAPALPRWKQLAKNPRVRIGAAVALLLLIVGSILAAYYWPSGETQEPEEPEQVANQTAPAEEPPPEEPEVKVETVSWEPFWVEYVTTEGEVRFLHAKFATTTEDPKLAFEISRKETMLRDAIYYYLRNKDLIFLPGKENGEPLKKELLSVINQYLTGGQLDVLLIEEYLVK